MTPAIAIKLECRWCMGSVRSFSCDSQICKLNNQSLTPLRRIKAHCLDCVETKQEIKKCTGKLLFEDRLCYLHPYRLGRNPKIKAGVTSHLERFKFSKRHATIV
ncbi:hypothetical protein [Candidatus Brocadia sinica]|uniref:hypothetical protein n=1 Tax=Candidatus Brocadia sinica TaxID=795830 RepID=UPI0012FED7CB|nr:hypothetical protein [Candidatus Brocadia sinica]NOG40076.1 hypothetical protein [Planctomycetota bacterium]